MQRQTIPRSARITNRRFHDSSWARLESRHAVSPRGPSSAIRAEALESRLMLALTPTLVADVNTAGESSNPSGFVQVNNYVVFLATDSAQAQAAT